MLGSILDSINLVLYQLNFIKIDLFIIMEGCDIFKVRSKGNKCVFSCTRVLFDKELI